MKDSRRAAAPDGNLRRCLACGVPVCRPDQGGLGIGGMPQQEPGHAPAVAQLGRIMQDRLAVWAGCLPQVPLVPAPAC